MNIALIFYAIIVCNIFFIATSMKSDEVQTKKNIATDGKKKTAKELLSKTLPIFYDIAINKEIIALKAQSEHLMSQEELCDLYERVALQREMNRILKKSCRNDPFMIYKLLPLYLKDVCIEADYLKGLKEERKIDNEFYAQHENYLEMLRTILHEFQNESLIGFIIEGL